MIKWFLIRMKRLYLGLAQWCAVALFMSIITARIHVPVIVSFVCMPIYQNCYKCKVLWCKRWLLTKNILFLITLFRISTILTTHWRRHCLLFISIFHVSSFLSCQLNNSWGIGTYCKSREGFKLLLELICKYNSCGYQI